MTPQTNLNQFSQKLTNHKMNVVYASQIDSSVFVNCQDSQKSKLEKLVGVVSVRLNGHLVGTQLKKSILE